MELVRVGKALPLPSWRAQKDYVHRLESGKLDS